MGATERKRYEKIHRNRMQTHRVRRKRKARRRPAPCLGSCYGIRGVRCPYIERDNPEGLPPLQEKPKLINLKFKIMKGSKIIETLVKVVVAALTAFLTALTTTSCFGYGPL